MKLTTLQVEYRLQKLDLSLLKKPLKNKGLIGQMLEKALGIENSSSLIDMKDGELKCFTKGQSICITSLNHCLNDILEFCLDFEKSKVLSKIKNVIYVAYGNDGKFLKWKTINLIDNYELYIKLEDDYNYISDEIKKRIYKY